MDYGCSWIIPLDRKYLFAYSLHTPIGLLAYLGTMMWSSGMFWTANGLREYALRIVLLRLELAQFLRRSPRNNLSDL